MCVIDTAAYPLYVNVLVKGKEKKGVRGPIW